MGALRTPEMDKKYKDYQKEKHFSETCVLCDKAPIIREFNHWKIAENIFPWDRISKLQHLLLPKRHIKYEELDEAEKLEFENIKQGFVEERYDITAEAVDKVKSIPSHFHLHLIVLKD